MTRITLVAFFLLTGFFYVTGKPVDQNTPLINTFAMLEKQNSVDVRSSSSFAPRQVRPVKRTQSAYSASSSRRSPVRVSQKTSALVPDMPVRNPRRMQASLPQYAKSILTSGHKASSPRQQAKLATGQTTSFGEHRIKVSSGPIKPLGLSYRQRYAKATKPVLGPRLTAVLLKRELRRVGCYAGNVTSKWDGDAKTALANFNTNAGTTLATTTPTVASLERLQRVTTVVCSKKPEVGGTIIATGVLTMPAAKIKSTAWRTKVEVRKTAYRPLPTTRRKRPTYNSIGRADFVEPYYYADEQRVKRRKVSRKYRKKRRARRIRVSKRKARRRTAVRSWRRTYRRKRFGFRRTGGGLSLGD